MSESYLPRVRDLCMAFPEIEERPSHGAPSFFVRGKRTLAMFHDGHHGDGRVSLWMPQPDGIQLALVDRDPERFLVPPYVGHRGWVAVVLDEDSDWEEIRELLEQAFRKVAPKKLIRLLDAT